MFWVHWVKVNYKERKSLFITLHQIYNTTQKGLYAKLFGMPYICGENLMMRCVCSLCPFLWIISSGCYVANIAHWPKAHAANKKAQFSIKLHRFDVNSISTSNLIMQIGSTISTNRNENYCSIQLHWMQYELMDNTKLCVRTYRLDNIIYFGIN